MIVIQFLATERPWAQAIPSAKPIQPQEEFIARAFKHLVDFLGSESAAVIAVFVIGSILTYIGKDLIPAFCKWLVAKVLGFFNEIRGQNLSAYRRSVITRCDQIRVGYKNFVIDVARDYVSLQIKTGMSDRDVELKGVDEVLREYPRLVVRGHPGSGKTTLLKYLAIRYAAKKMKSLHGKHLIPVFVSLKDVTVSADSPSADLFEYMTECFKRDFQSPGNYLREQLRKGNCIVLLDGADEVRSDRIGSLLQGIDAFANEFETARIIATVRKEGYEKIGLGARFKETEVAGLTVPQMETLASSVLRANRPESKHGGVAEKCDELIRKIKNNPRLFGLAENPMLLSIIALVFDEQGDLPRKRVELYEYCLRLILEVREEREAGIKYRLITKIDQKYYALRKLALFFVERNESQFSGDLLKQQLKSIAPEINLPVDRCDDFVDELCKIGILHRISSLGEQYDFVHKTFLEYLAAREIQENPPRERLVFEHAEDPAWREVILLYIGLLGDPKPLIETLTRRGQVALAGEGFLNARIQTDNLRSSLIEGLVARLAEGGRDRERVTPVLMEMILPCLGELIDRAEVQAFLEARIQDPLERMETKAAIYQAALLLEPDAAKRFGERFDLVYIRAGKSFIGTERSGLEKLPGWRALAAWIRIDQTPLEYLIDLPRQEIETPAYFLDKFPVTNRDYERFIKAGGYRDSRYWTRDGWDYVTKESLSEPRYWQQEKWNPPDHPAVGVSWYEADAYARWAGKHLPTERLWEKAARGDDERIYPWGNESPDQALCNYGQGVGKTTPVGRYEKGRSPYGAYDMAGNVWEWCDSDWGYGANAKVVRGGWWYNDPGSLRASSRSWGNPTSRLKFVGFRCARTL
ncbi:MAG: SUMF1/EgtB/PvdO family nonheme iron enzyme [Methylococcaceae bacterium]|nr:SUMF1/EgtB/PvdO family nonheme iron enzyme [Methylococcaceae bacterium]